MKEREPGTWKTGPRGGGETITARYEDNAGSAVFSLIYAALLGCAAFGLALAGTTTPRWVTYRRINTQGQTPAMVRQLRSA